MGKALITSGFGGGGTNFVLNEETPIGTWIDGKTIYRKVIQDTFTQGTGSGRSLGISNVYQWLAIDVRMSPLATFTTNCASSVYWQSSSDYFNWYLSTPKTGTLVIRGGSDWPKTCTIYIFCFYTKNS